MLYLANPSNQAIRDAMTDGVIGMIDTPLQRNLIPPRAIWCADNGRFSKGWPGDEAYFRWLDARLPEIQRCLFAVIPDVPMDMNATLAEFHRYAPQVRSRGYPVALALQNGAEDMDLEWDDLDAVFIGGDTAFKLGTASARLAAEAGSRGKHVHMGRVNSWKRFCHAAAIGCDSADGTFLTFGPDGNWPRVQVWLDHYRRRGAQRMIV